MNQEPSYSNIEKFALKLVSMLKAEERWPSLFTRIQLKLILLEGPATESNAASCFIGRALMMMLGAFLLVIVCGLAAQDTALLVTAMSLVTLIPVFTLRRLDNRIRNKKRRIIIELPELLSKIVLLVNAGDTVQQAIGRCAPHLLEGEAMGQEKEDSKSHLNRELSILINDLGNNLSFSVALENFSKRCSVQEVSLFTNTVLLNYRRGGEDFVTSLRELNRVLWEKRKSLAKTLGEEASSKLVFPMVLIFLVVTVIVAAPAILMMDLY
ncbi:MAG: type II secretion system protein [Gorillibacterium sp.]|nr:type II secretion system protein [Gorillibacterium sp.]